METEQTKRNREYKRKWREKNKERNAEMNRKHQKDYMKRLREKAKKFDLIEEEWYNMPNWICNKKLGRNLFKILGSLSRCK